MRTLLSIVLVLWLTPALAAGCDYVDSRGDRLAFIADGQNTVAIAWANGARTSCSWGINGDTAAHDIQCADGTEADYFFAPSSPKADDRGLLVFNSEVWYCKAGL